MSGTLFIFSNIDPLDNILLSSIQSVEIVGDKIRFNIVDELGKKQNVDKPNTPFIMDQINGFNLEIYS